MEAAERRGMPLELQPLFGTLKNDLILAHEHWIYYRQLFGTSQARVELINRTAVSFFARLEWLFLNDVTLRLSRLTDPPRQGRRQNLVLENLVGGLDGQFADLATRMRDRLSSVKVLCAPFRQRRNRAVAHSDRATWEDPKEILPGVSREMVENALTEMAAYLNEFQLYFEKSTTRYRDTITSNDGDALIIALRTAKDYEALAKEGVIPRERWIWSRRGDGLGEDPASRPE